MEKFFIIYLNPHPLRFHHYHRHLHGPLGQIKCHFDLNQLPEETGAQLPP